MRYGSIPVLRLLKFGAAAVVGGVLAGAGVIVAEARQARRRIPRVQTLPPRCDGWYGGHDGDRAALTMVMLGDSSAAGLGVNDPRHTPGARLAAAIARRTGRPVHLTCLAFTGATSADLALQVDEALKVAPELAVIVIGANDIVNRVRPATAVGHLAHAVDRLRAAGAQVVVGTCPDLSAIPAIRPPLRWLVGYLSRRLAAAQTVAVTAAGAHAVPIGELLGARFAADPDRLFCADRFHPSAEGYAAAAAVLLPATLVALGVEEQAATVPAAWQPRALPEAAQQALARLRQLPRLPVRSLPKLGPLPRLALPARVRSALSSTATDPPVSAQAAS